MSQAQVGSGPDEVGQEDDTVERPAADPPTETPDTACKDCGRAAPHTPHEAETHQNKPGIRNRNYLNYILHFSMNTILCTFSYVYCS